MSNYDKFKLNDEDIKIGIEDFFTQILIEERRRKNRIKSLSELSSEVPTIIYIAGQPGSGKTTLSNYKESQYDSRDEAIVEVGSDKIATFHRDYEKQGFDKIIYQLTEGIGKSRGAKTVVRDITL